MGYWAFLVFSFVLDEASAKFWPYVRARRVPAPLPLCGSGVARRVWHGPRLAMLVSLLSPRRLRLL